MFVKKLKDCPEFISGDGVILRELLHRDKGDFTFRYSLAHAKLPSGRASSPHRLKHSEVYYIIKGKALMHIDNKSCVVGPGDSVYIRPHAVQYIKNTGKKMLEFLCIVDPAWEKKDEEILK
ncbi:MAG: cupin domain-containing protein [Candidatus Omnitrophica bacterium]|jgi:mannose-6-phosphate isomerase-like protein (cupin superfamily)|nr:cupin domain-containing protein [Candidatus Omnitrophota bacterium]